MQLNSAQQLFVVFYAIFWGALANALPRWKAFNFGQVFQGSYVWKRVLLSVVLLNVAPLLFFVQMLYILRYPFWWYSTAVAWSGSARILGGIVPAFATFGFYRLWIAIVQCFPTTFYGPASGWETKEWENRHPNFHPQEHFRPGEAGPNLFFAFVYILVAELTPILLSCHYS